MPNIYPVDEADAKSLVRGLTLYEDSPDELPSDDLDTHIRIAKMRLKTETGSSDFYTDDGLGQALVATTAIIAKAAIENFSVDRWDIGQGEIDVSGSGDTDNAQFGQWAQMASDGISESSTSTKSSAPTPSNSASYVGR